MKRKIGWPTGLVGTLFVLEMLLVFGNTLLPDWVTFSPDCTKFFTPDWFISWWNGVLTGHDSLHPFTLMNFLGHPLWRRELLFILSTFGGGLGVAYYLRIQKLDSLAALGGGLFFSLCGYSFTLFCAGHAGYFELISCGMFAFGLLAKCFDGGKPIHYVLLGAVMAWSEVRQPDVWFIFMLLLGAYGLWRTFRWWRERHDCGCFKTVYPKLLLTALTVAVIGGEQIRTALTAQLDARKQQMSGVQKSDAAAPKTSEENWIFATNWSLPPEDILEFAAPGVFGDCSFTPPNPYWGRLGRPVDYKPGSQMPNYRQHTVYLGIATILLALAAFRRKKSVRDPECGESAPCFSDAPFWAGAAVVATLFALGRFTPAYRLFYSLPYMNFIRCPVKFHHLTELAVCVLAGFGLQRYLAAAKADEPERAAFVKHLFAIATGLAVLLLAGAIVGGAATKTFAGKISQLGITNDSAALAKCFPANCARSLAFLGVVFAAMWFGLRRQGKTVATVCLAMPVVLGSLDLALVAKRYIQPRNVTQHYSENVLIAKMHEITKGKPAKIANFVTSGGFDQDWFGASLFINGYDNVLMPNEETQKTVLSLYQKFQSNPAALCSALGAELALFPVKAGFFQINTSVEPLFFFNIRRGRDGFKIDEAKAPAQDTLALGRPKPNTSLPTLYPVWHGAVEPDRQLDDMISGFDGRPYSNAPASSGESSGGGLAVKLDAYRGQTGVRTTRGTVNNTGNSDRLLVFGDRYSSELAATVDGKPTPVYLANNLWAAITVPPGKHQIALAPRIAPLAVAGAVVSALLMAVMVGLGIRKVLRHE